MQIASSIDGRVRIRDQQLTRTDVASAIEAKLSALPGVAQVSVNGKIGSLLVVYSAAAVTLKEIMKTISTLLGETELPLRETRNERAESVFRIRPLTLPGKRSIVNMGMLASLVTSMVGIMIGLKKLHYAAGVVFLAFFGIHIFERRAAMFA